MSHTVGHQLWHLVAECERLLAVVTRAEQPHRPAASVTAATSDPAATAMLCTTTTGEGGLPRLPRLTPATDAHHRDRAS
jgi:hypothetical protein